MIKVLHVTGLMNRGGAEVMVMDLLRNKSDNVHFDFLVHVNKNAKSNQGDFDDEILSLGASINHINPMHEIGFMNYTAALKSIFESIKPDVIHLHVNAKSGVIAMVANRVGVRKIVTHSHADIKFRGSVLYRFFVTKEFWIQKKLISRYSTDYWGCSEEACKSLFPSIDSNKFKIINNAVDVSSYISISQLDIDAFRASVGINEDDIVIGNIGRIVKHKNLLFVIEILKLLVRKNPKYKLLYAGRDDDKEYHQEVLAQIKENGLEGNVIYLGVRDDVPMLMSAMDIFVGPALQEGFGLVAVEAQAAGKHCILYKGFPQLVDMKLGLVHYHNDFDIDKWINTILSLDYKKVISKSTIRNTIQKLGFDSAVNSKFICSLYEKY